MELKFTKNKYLYGIEQKMEKVSPSTKTHLLLIKIVAGTIKTLQDNMIDLYFNIPNNYLLLSKWFLLRIAAPLLFEFIWNAKCCPRQISNA